MFFENRSHLPISRHVKNSERRRKKYWNVFFGNIEEGLKSSKLDSTNPRGAIFFETSREWFMNRWNRGSNAWFTSSHHRWPLQRNIEYYIRSPNSNARLLTRKFVRKRVSKTNIFHVRSAICLHLDFGEDSILRRNLAPWKLSYLDIIYEMDGDDDPKKNKCRKWFNIL